MAMVGLMTIKHSNDTLRNLLVAFEKVPGESADSYGVMTEYLYKE